MKKTLKLRKLRLGEPEVRVISTYDLRDIVGGTTGGGGSTDPIRPNELRSGASESS